MEAVLLGIEQLGVVKAIKSSFFIYPVINALHILAVGALLTSVIMLDLRVLGFLRSMPEAAFIKLLRRVALGAFALALLTGVTMFSVRATEYAVMPLFLLKLGLIGLAGVNFVLFQVMRRKGPRRALAVVSMGLWASVLLAGRFLGFV